MNELDSSLAQARDEIARLQRQVDEQAVIILRLTQWMQSLQQDIQAVYKSVTWLMGDRITQAVLWLLRRPVGPTARDHVDKIHAEFESWKTSYFRQSAGATLHTAQYMPWHGAEEYQNWIRAFDTPSAGQLAALHAVAATMGSTPDVAVLLRLPEDTAEYLGLATLASLAQQIYPRWQLIAVGPREPVWLAEWRIAHPQGLFLTTSAPRAQWLGLALQAATAQWVAVMDAGDGLSAHALLHAVRAMREEIDWLYSDSDQIDDQGNRFDPYFKPDWSPDLFHAQFYCQRLALYRRTRVNEVGGFRSEANAAQEYDLALRLSRHCPATAIGHLPHVLYHRYGSADRANQDVAQAELDALQQYFSSVNLSTTIHPAYGNSRHVRYPLPSPMPLVSVIIPTRDRVELLRGTVEGVLQHTDYAAIELIIVDNASQLAETLDYLTDLRQDPRVRVLRDDSPFNYSRLNNLAARQARGELLALLNNDLKIIRADWLAEMVGHAVRPEIGAVGTKLYFANNTIQHAGVVVGLGGMAGHHFKYLPRQMPGYQWWPFLTRNVSAATGACLLLRREVYHAVGGLDEKNLKVAFNDVDFCLRIRKQGYRIVCTPHAEMYHLESASRGIDTTLPKFLRLQAELRYMRRNWSQVIAYDPYYNPNLTVEYEDFSLASQPRVEHWRLA